MSRSDTPGQGRQADMSYEALKQRLMAHVLHGQHGSALVSVRVADVRAIIELADRAEEAADIEAELMVIKSRIARAVGVLKA
jgi:hypothetical protein